MIRLSLHPLKTPFHTWRTLLFHPLSLLLFFASPVLGLFHLDVIHGHVIYGGAPYPFSIQSLMWLPIVFYGGVILIGIASFLLGRVFCGWVCPHNILTEVTRPIRAAIGRDEYPIALKKWFKSHPHAHTVWQWISPFLALTIATTMALLLSLYIVPLPWVLQQYGSGAPHISLSFGHGLFTFIGLFLLYCGHDFCKTCCPYGMAQSISAYQSATKLRPMEIKFLGHSLTRDCGPCKTCHTACPVDVDPRTPEGLKVGQFDGCFNCGICIDACNTIHRPRLQPGLLSFTPPTVHRTSPSSNVS